MTGNLNLRGNKITRLDDPEGHCDAVHKRCIDTQAIFKHGGEMLGDLQMNGRVVRGLLTSPITTDCIGNEVLSYRQITNFIDNLATRAYVDNTIVAETINLVVNIS